MRKGRHKNPHRFNKEAKAKRAARPDRPLVTLLYAAIRLRYALH